MQFTLWGVPLTENQVAVLRRYTDLPLADWELKLLKGDEVTIQEGSKVRVTFEGDYFNKSIQDNHNIRIGGDKWNPGPTFTVPKGAKIEVLEEPVPAEPKPGSVVQFEDGAVFANVPWDITMRDLWVRLDRTEAPKNNFGFTSQGYQEWADVVARHGSLFTYWGKPEVDLSLVKPFVAYGDKTKYNNCLTGQGELSVYRPDSLSHVRLDFQGNLFCMTSTYARSLALRLLKTFEGE